MVDARPRRAVASKEKKGVIEELPARVINVEPCDEGGQRRFDCRKRIAHWLQHRLPLVHCLRSFARLIVVRVLASVLHSKLWISSSR